MPGDITCIGAAGGARPGPGLPPAGDGQGTPGGFAALVDDAAGSPGSGPGATPVVGKGHALRAAIAHEWWAMLVSGALSPAVAPPAANVASNRAKVEGDGDAPPPEAAAADEEDDAVVTVLPPAVAIPLLELTSTLVAGPAAGELPLTPRSDGMTRDGAVAGDAVAAASAAILTPGPGETSLVDDDTGGPDTAPTSPATGAVVAGRASPSAKATPARPEISAWPTTPGDPVTTPSAQVGASGPPIDTERSPGTDAAMPAAPKAAAARLARTIDALAGGDQPTPLSEAMAAAASGGDAGRRGEGSGARTTDGAATLLRATPSAAPGVPAFVVPGAWPAAPEPAATLAASAPAPGQPANGPSPETLHALVQAMRVQVRGGIGEAVVRLRPDHLGEVSIALQVEGSAVTATIRADTPAVREWVAAQEALLRQGLADQGLDLERLVVQPDDQPAHQDPDPRRHGQGRRPPARQSRPGTEDEPRFAIVV